MKREPKHATGKDYWLNLKQSAAKAVKGESDTEGSPAHHAGTGGPFSRRDFLTLMGASLALAGLTGCRRPKERILPYVRQPEEIIPGKPVHYATTMPLGTSAYGLVVESHEGRPTKIEGNELHPSTLGGSDVFMQAGILDLYDPDRSSTVLQSGVSSDWNSFVTFWREQYPIFRGNRGEGLAVLTEEFCSPTLASLSEGFQATFPNANFISYEPVSDENIHEGVNSLTATAGPLRPDYHFERARVIFSLDSDFLLTESNHIVAAGRFIEGREVGGNSHPMNRLYVAEPVFTVTGAMADHRMRLQRRLGGPLLVALALELQKRGLKIDLGDALTGHHDHRFDNRWLGALAGDLLQHRSRGLIVAGRCQLPEVHQLALLLNQALGNYGETVVLQEARDVSFSDHEGMRRLVDGMAEGRVKTLVIIGGNPVYNCSGTSRFDTALARVEHGVHLSSHVDETSQQCEWHLPKAHFLESWGDARALDGTLSIIQPLIEPLYRGHSDVELLELLCHGRDRRGYDVVRETWQSILKGAEFEAEWRQVLHDGVLAGSAIPGVNPRLSRTNSDTLLRTLERPMNSATTDKPEILFQASPSVFDGRYANNGWLQELSDPISKLTWDNAAVISPRSARDLLVENNDVVRLSHENENVEIPVWVIPGTADGVIGLAMGYGRKAAGRVGTGVGVDVFKLRASTDSYCVNNIAFSLTGRRHELASTQDHGSMEGRPIIREGTLDEYLENPGFAREAVDHPPLRGIYAEHDYSQGYQWAMVTDLNRCLACNACAIACQSENNIQVVGKDQVLKGREMSWIRIDRYFSGGADDPQVLFQPVACQHCENAPCEQVCPVAATSHDKEGLNVMTYNRCIGTRYCSNNCPYKVRRFNFFNYTVDMPEIEKMAQNPDVTVRSRGVMEKCTFCIQRINRARITAKSEERTLVDGEVVVACQQACPVKAITFGNENDPESKVRKLRKHDRSYELLAEFNTRPRHSYLAKLRNPHPELGEYVPKNG